MLLANLVFIIIVLKCIWDYDRKTFVDHYIILVTTLVMFIAFNIKFSMNSIELRIKKKELENFNMYAPMVFNIIDEVRRKQHDFKNHLNTIYGIVQVEDEENLKTILTTYISSLNSSLKDIDTYIQFENKVVMGIVYSKLCEARIKNIKFNYEFEHANIRFPVKDYELSQILNNLIDNAFEAVEFNEENGRNVYLSIAYENDKVYIETKNLNNTTNPEIISRIFKKGFSTKSKKGRGYGLYNIKQIVESYNGKIQLSQEEKIIIFRIIFPKICID